MASPSTIPNLVTNTNTSRDSIRKRRKNKTQQKHHQQDQIQNINQKWKSQTQQQTYSSKLRQALTRVNSSSAPRRGKAVREAADRALAITAKGKTRWSRAILKNRLKLKFRKKKRQRVTLTESPSTRYKKSRVNVLRLKGKVVPSMQRKVRFLGRLVPGCKKEALPVILEEAIDYIPALEMQVRAMSALFNLLSASTSGAGDGSGR